MSKKNNSRFKVVLFFLMQFTTTNLLATGQLPDLLVVNNDTSYIYSNPLFLEVYFNKNGNRNSINFEGCLSSSCLRGYQAIWTIEKDSFFLIKVIGCMCSERQEADLKLIFGDNYKNQKVFADWFSGLLVNPYGRRIRYYHIGFSSIYEFENNYQIVSGVVVKRKKYINYREGISKRNRLDYLCAKHLIYEHVNKYLKWNKIKKESAVLMNLEIIINKHGKLNLKNH